MNEFTEGLSTQANTLFEIAQKIFGPKCDQWKFEGVFIGDNGPSTMYHFPSKGDISISLSDKILNDDIQSLFQLSHEVCHLLHPSRDCKTDELYDTIVFNEGIATYFQVLITSNIQDPSDLVDNLKSHNVRYFNAYKLLEQLMEIDSEMVIKIRDIQPRIDLVTEIDFQRIGSNIPKELVLSLLEKW